MAAVVGDGYENNKSPHSKYELFEGLTVGRTALVFLFFLLSNKSYKFINKNNRNDATLRLHVFEKFSNVNNHNAHQKLILFIQFYFTVKK